MGARVRRVNVPITPAENVEQEAQHAATEVRDATKEAAGDAKQEVNDEVRRAASASRNSLSACPGDRG